MHARVNTLPRVFVSGLTGVPRTPRFYKGLRHFCRRWPHVLSALTILSQEAFSMRRTVTISLAGLILLVVSASLLACPNLLTPGRTLSASPAPAEPQAAGETNLALGKPATQSTTGWGSPASLAVDGNTDGDWFHGSVSHTNGDPQGWWQVDLGSAQQVGKVDVHLMTICCSSHQNFDVKVSTDGANWQSFYVAGPVDYVGVPVNLGARYVRVQLRDTDYLALAEVQVFGASTQVQAGQAYTPP